MNDDRALVEIDLSGIGVVVRGAPHATVERLRGVFARYLRPVENPLLTVEVSVGPALAPPVGTFAPKQMRAALDRSGARYELPEGRATVDPGGRARIELCHGLGSREYFALANLLRACLAWALPGCGGAMLHAAGLVVDGRAFLLVGPEGSGKSTWTRCGVAAGALPISDDIVLVVGAAGGALALGAPFRSTLETEGPPGRWPVSAILLPRHGERPRWSRASGPVVAARLTANLPFVAEGIERDPRIARTVEALAGLPAAEFWFAPDPSFMEVLRAWPS